VRGRRAQGIRYEKKVHEHFEAIYGEHYVPSLWLQFGSDGSPMRYCQPDALLIDIERGIITVIEVKYQHTSDAWYQVNQLYLPVLRRMFPSDLWEFKRCEVVKWYDPATRFPEEVSLARDIEAIGTGKFGVHIWKP